MANVSRVYEIGNMIKLRKETDDNYRITDYIRSNLSVVDLMPVNYHLTLANVNNHSWGVEYDFNSAKEDYGKVLSKYGLDSSVNLLRLWLTDDTVISESFNNNFNPNIIETGLNSLDGISNTVQTMRQLTKSVDNTAASKIGQRITSTISEGIKASRNMLFADSELAKVLEDQAISVTNTVGSVIFEGKHVSLPKIWTSSTYLPTLTVTLKLVSPYGHPTAIKEFITRPLIYLLALISPKTNDGLSYGLSQPLYVNGYGISNIKLASVLNVTMRRGGKETAFNIYKQPLILDVMITIQPLTEGFASVTGNLSDITTINDADTSGDIQGTTGPAITTLGNIIQSMRPAPANIVGTSTLAVQNEHKAARPGRTLASSASAAAQQTGQNDSQILTDQEYNSNQYYV